MNAILTYLCCLLLIQFIKGGSNSSFLETEEVSCDEGGNVTLKCQRGNSKAYDSVIWRFPGRDLQKSTRSSVKIDNSLTIRDVSREDDGVYTCAAETEKNDEDIVVNRIKVTVRTPPPKLVNVTVTPSTILASLQWEVANTGGHPVTSFTVQYRLKHILPNHTPDVWHSVLPGNKNISPTTTKIDVFKLKPNSTYIFQVWANNKLGRGELTEVEGQTLHDQTEMELAKHLLEGAETFDTRIWVAAVAIVMGTLVILATATIYALYKEYHVPNKSTEPEALELIPNIILNPGYNDNDIQQTEWMEPDENSNDTVTLRLNNNNVVLQLRV